MSTHAQITANQTNAQSSTGPKSEAGKATSSLNHFRHGLTGRFVILNWEKAAEFAELAQALRDEHQPATPTEVLLIEAMAQHYWLRQRAMRLQEGTMSDVPRCARPEELALYLRYQTTHERAFHRCLNQLLKLRAEKRKAENGFESQEQKKELHQWKILHAKAKAEHHVLLNAKLAGPDFKLAVTPERLLAAQKAA
jgi:hypothetical protein